MLQPLRGLVNSVGHGVSICMHIYSAHTLRHRVTCTHWAHYIASLIVGVAHTPVEKKLLLEQLVMGDAGVSICRWAAVPIACCLEYEWWMLCRIEGALYTVSSLGLFRLSLLTAWFTFIPWKSESPNAVPYCKKSYQGHDCNHQSCHKTFPSGYK